MCRLLLYMQHKSVNIREQMVTVADEEVDLPCDEVASSPAVGWSEIPDMILRRIYALLPLRSRLHASLTCMRWHAELWTNEPWHTFVFKDYVCTRRRFTQHAGYHYALDYLRLRMLVMHATWRWRVLVFRPVSLFHNLYDFMRSLTNYSEIFEHAHRESPFDRLQCFEFNWQLKFQTSETGPIIYGTGGHILQGILLFLQKLTNLEEICFRQLLLDPYEADAFLADLLNQFGGQLRVLTLINFTREPRAFLHMGLFLKLEKLVISPQHLNDDVIFLLANCRYLAHIVLVQDENTPANTEACSELAWSDFAKLTMNNVLVHLRVAGQCNRDLLLQPGAPVESIVYAYGTASKITVATVSFICEHYANTLKQFVQKGIQRQYRRKSFGERADAPIVSLVKHCRQLEVLAIRERLSTATVLLVAHLCSYKEYFWLYVRRNALVLRQDWPFNNQEWSMEFYCWLRRNAQRYAKVNAEVSKLLNKRWRSLSDRCYKDTF